MSDWRIIGKKVKSKEGPRHVTGGGRFIDDLNLPGMLHALVVRSTYAHARILKVNVQAALESPGVAGALTPEDVKAGTHVFKPGRYSAGLKKPVAEYATAIDKVRYVGEPIGMVAARDAGLAEDALEKVSVDYEPLEPVVDPIKAQDASAPVLFEELGTNVAWKGTVQYGNVDAAFASADQVVREHLKTHRYSSTPLEPLGCVASFEPASRRLTVWCNGQNPQVIYDALGQSIDMDDFKVIIPDIGGGFGQKIHLIRKYVVLTALMSIKTGRPVKWVEDRSEHMMAAGQTANQQFEIEAAVKKDGTVLGLKINETDDVGGSVSTLTIHFTNKLNNLFGNYRVKHLQLNGQAVVTNKCPVVPNRGIGKPAMCFIWERTMDRVAKDLGLSPEEVRLKNLVPPEEFPYETPNGNVYDSGNYPDLLNRAIEKLDLPRLRKEQEQLRKEGRLLGFGIVMGVEPGGRNAARDMAIFPDAKEMPGVGGVQGSTMKLEKNGTVSVALASPSCGQYHETTACQVVSEITGIPYDKINGANQFDSKLSPWGVGSSNTGNNFHLWDIGAVHGAATRLRQKILTLAQRILKTADCELTIEDGVVRSRLDPEKQITLARLGKIAYTDQSYFPDDLEPGLESTFYYKFPHAQPYMIPDKQGRVRAQFSFSTAAHAAVVEINRETGRVKVVRYVIVSDNGTILNEDVVDGQVYGSLSHGISTSLGEGFVYGEDGQLHTITLTDYGKPTTVETPVAEIEHRGSPSPFTVLGQKAAGEGAAIPSPAAIARAVENALEPLGIDIHELPLSAERVWNLMRAKASA